MTNIWKHIRLGGAVISIIGSFINRADMALVGLMIIAVGVVGGVDRLERLVNDLKRTAEERDDN